MLSVHPVTAPKPMKRTAAILAEPGISVVDHLFTNRAVSAILEILDAHLLLIPQPSPFCKQHFLCFMPEPQGHGLLRG